MRVLSFIIVFSLFTSFVSARTFYVDAVAGKDGNDGLSTQTAWNSLTAVNNRTFAPGDSILLKRGQTWRQELDVPSSGAANSPLTFGAYGDVNADPPTISGANLMTGWTVQQGNVWRAPLGKEPNIVAFNSIIGSRKTGLANLGTEHDWCWSANMLYVYAPGNPGQRYSKPGVEAASRTYCIYTDNHSYVHYENLNLTYGNRSCFRSDTNDNQLQFTEVCARGAGDTAGFEFESSLNVTLVRCRVDWCRSVTVGDGFQFKGGCGNITLQDCRASYNLRRGTQFDTGTSGFIHIFGGEYHHQFGLNQSDGISIDKNDGVLIDGVWSHDNGINNDSADGVQISGGSRNPIVRYCRLENNYNAGLILDSDGGSLYYNVSIHNRHGIGIDGNPTLPLNINNNTCYNNEYGIFFYEKSPLATVNVINNILYGAGDHQHAAHLAAGLSTSAINMDNNLFWGDNQNDMVEWDSATYSRDQFAQYQANTGKNPHSLCADPQFVDPLAGDFRLKPGSPCIDKGQSVSLSRDFFGTTVPVNGKPDIGANEYLPSGNVALPHVTGITRLDSNPIDTQSVRYNVNFNTPVDGVSTQVFQLITTQLNSAQIASVTGSGSSYTVTINTGSGDGTLLLALYDTGVIADLNGQPLGGAGPNNGSFYGGESYTIDRTAPVTRVTSAKRQGTIVGMLNQVALSVAYQASDAVSGIKSVRLFYRKNNIGSFLQYGDTYTQSPISLALPGDTHVVELYTLGLDRAGNLEPAPTQPDVTLTLANPAAHWTEYN